jgi:hypothetical protein
MRRYPTAPVPTLPRISVARSGTDFTAIEADFAALIQAAGFALGDQPCHVAAAGLIRSWQSDVSGLMSTRAAAAQAGKS